MGTRHQKTCLANNCNDKNSIKELFGIEIKSHDIETFRRMLLFISTAIYDWFNNCFTSSYGFQLLNSMKYYSTYIICKELHIENLIPKCEIIEISNLGKVGLLTNACDFSDPNNQKYSCIKPIFQKQLVELQIISIICYQLDWRPGNYFVETNDKKEAISLVAIDNDNINAFKCVPKILFTTYCGIDSPIKDGYWRLPYIPKNLYYNLGKFKIRKTDLNKYISKAQIIFMKIRVKRLLRAMKKSLLEKRSILLEDSEWNSSTIEKEFECCNPHYSYLCYFYDNYISKKTKN